ncbi:MULTISPECIES: tetratricopeptide repeat protein [Bifidobacterium]|uniref:Co-chaperone YbbN n=1 Tax=Bifidobacterium tibiigranuli TaxID=2172043 RepID=A0A5N6S5Q9_9BIFI|nr:tetratricopeptide repeat protein [Bifidobacterium tibiigranuli]KAE8129159.1 co-chaperone YbbN [Bifidobacterium tibiigranuli]KAE8129397.1 co-chaperone YbbN [Bifidobacterium tibiigranuli]MCI1210359.1 tetratricopeptide repeat protein [Bifidobacterium tibiigranuli]MCI1221166.1 tetratricopeptide repeat protein [Bifidobacterium tibiigranuli]MCI1231765.1 tetratricopeptide repeat protein [Bifidobacterium tibiigranuli]
MAGQQQYNPGMSLAGAVDLESLKHQAEAEAEPGQAGGAPKAGGYVVDTSENTFQAMVQTSSTFPIVLLLWTPTDSRMFELARTLGETVNAMNGQIQLSRIDVASNPSIAQALQVQGAPALFGLVSGRPMPILQGLPQGDELRQVCDEVIPQLVQLAQQSGVTGTAPYADIPDDGDAAGEASEAESQVPQIPPEHAQAHLLAQNGDYEGAAAAYAKLVEADPHDELAARERSKALLLARSAKSNVRQVRAQAAAAPDDVDAQLAVADIDMIGGQIDDAFGRLLDYLASGHRDQIEPVRQRLLEYFAIPESADPRLSRARRRLATLMY